MRVTVVVVVCVCVYVCVCVCYHASCYISRLYNEIKVSLGFIWRFQDMHCVAFVENASFKSFGDICRPPLPSLLLDKLSMDKIDIDGSFSRRVVCRSSDRSYYSTDSTLVIVNCQTMLLALNFLYVYCHVVLGPPVEIGPPVQILWKYLDPL